MAIHRVIAILRRRIIVLAFAFGFKLILFLFLLGQLFLALFVSVIRCCQGLLLSNNEEIL